MRILHVTRNLPPLRGGMERLNRHIVLELCEDLDVVVIGPTGCASFLPSGLVVKEVPAQRISKFFLAVALASFRIAWRFRPQIIFAGSGLTAPFVFLASKITGAKSMVYLHGLDVIVKSWIYEAFWLPAICRCDRVFVNSNYTRGLAIAKGVRSERITVLHPGTSIPSDTGGTSIGFRRKYQLDDRPLLLSVGRLTRRKGLIEFVRDGLPKIVSSVPQALLVVIGDDATDALRGGNLGLREEIQALATSLNLEKHLMMLGPCSEEDLASAFFAASVHVFPVRETPGDIEGFGMVALEAAAHGLATVAFAVGGVTDAVCDGISGRLIPPGNYDAFAAAAIDVCLTSAREPIRRLAKEFAIPFEWKTFGEKLRRHTLLTVGSI